VTSVTHSGEITDTRNYVRNWATENPIRQSIAARESVMNMAAESELRGAFTTTEVVGDLSVTFDDLSRRIDIYGAQAFEQARWQAELLAMDMADQYEVSAVIPLAERAVLSAEEATSNLQQVIPSLNRALASVEAAPEVVSRERATTIEAVQAELATTIQFVQGERIAALEHLSEEREAALLSLHETLAAERAMLAEQAREISHEIVDHAFLRLSQLAAGFLVVVAILLFAALLVFRRWQRDNPPQ
jgi:septal ring factor EnvC (AmiA/AmiB activator)